MLCSVVKAFVPPADEREAQGVGEMRYDETNYDDGNDKQLSLPFSFDIYAVAKTWLWQRELGGVWRIENTIPC